MTVVSTSADLVSVQVPIFMYAPIPGGPREDFTTAVLDRFEARLAGWRLYRVPIYATATNPAAYIHPEGGYVTRGQLHVLHPARYEQTLAMLDAAYRTADPLADHVRQSVRTGAVIGDTVAVELHAWVYVSRYRSRLAEAVVGGDWANVVAGEYTTRAGALLPVADTP